MRISDWSSDVCSSDLETLVRVKDEYGLKEIRKPGITHGDYCFYFVDLDENWWEIVKTRPGLGHAEDFTDPERDLTGRGHEFVAKRGVHVHMHDPEFRKAINETSPRYRRRRLPRKAGRRRASR